MAEKDTRRHLVAKNVEIGHLVATGRHIGIFDFLKGRHLVVKTWYGAIWWPKMSNGATWWLKVLIAPPGGENKKNIFFHMARMGPKMPSSGENVV